MPETPRTWTLKRWETGQGTAITVASGPKLLPGNEPKVYEAAPVGAERERLLDLLERAMPRLDLGVPDAQDLSLEVVAALREYGRLGKGES